MKANWIVLSLIWWNNIFLFQVHTYKILLCTIKSAKTKFFYSYSLVRHGLRMLPFRQFQTDPTGFPPDHTRNGHVSRFVFLKSYLKACSAHNIVTSNALAIECNGSESETTKKKKKTRHRRRFTTTPILVYYYLCTYTKRLRC